MMVDFLIVWYLFIYLNFRVYFDVIGGFISLRLVWIVDL